MGDFKDQSLQPPAQDPEDPIYFVGKDQGPKRGLFIVLENDGKGKFKDVTATHFPNLLPANSYDVVVHDMDGDGDPDIVLPGTFNHWVNPIKSRIFFNTYRHLYGPKPPALGTPYDLQLMGPPKSVALLYASLGTKRIRLGRLGLLRLDPGKGILPMGLLVLDLKGQGKVQIPMLPKSDPRLKGASLYFQALMFQSKFPGSGFSNAVFEVLK